MSVIAEQVRSKLDYTYWQDALAGNFGPVHDADAQPGFWRKRTSRSGPFVPVAIWEHDGHLVALVDGKEADPSALWTYVCRYPITEAQYHARVNSGIWHDEDATVSASLEHRTDTNNPPTDEAEILKGQIEAASLGVSEYIDIRSDEAAAKAQSLRSRLLELSGSADKKREAEKKPFLESGKAVDAKWQPLVKLAKEAADTIRAALGAHETRKANAAEVARREAENIRIKAEREAAKAAASGKPAPAAPPPPPVEPAPAAAIRGAYGRAAAVKVVKVAKIVDQDAAYHSLRTHKELIELMGRLAQRAADAGISLNGVEVTEERVVT